MNGAAALVEMLVGYGVEVIFGVPGDTNVALYQALKANGGRLRHVTCRDERSAVFMADCYARLTGKPGVAEVPSGAGAMYGLPGVAEATQSSVPLILLVNDIPQPGMGRGTLTELPVTELFNPIAKRAEALGSIQKLPEVVRRAFRLATGGRPGAVVLSLPEDILYETLPDSASLHVEQRCRSAPSSRVHAAASDVEMALETLHGSKRPLIVAGGGVNRSQAGDMLTRLAEKLMIPVVTTITGQGVIPDDHRLAIGIIGDNGFHPHALWALRQADLAIYVGCRMGSVATMNWKLPTDNSATRIIQIDIDPGIIANTYDVDLAMVGDAQAVLSDLYARAPVAVPDAREEWIAEINGRRKEFWRGTEPRLKSVQAPLLPERVIDALAGHLSGPCNVISDAGTPTPYSTRFLRLDHPRSKLVIPRFFGGLGYAIPAVVGAHFACPEMRSVALFGDGSLGMSAGELETIARLKVPVVLIHFNNACFGWIKALQRVQSAGHDNEGTFGVDFSNLDMSKLAQVYGIRSFRVQTSTELEQALAAAFASDEPVFVDIVVESIADRLPPVFSWLEKSGVDPEDVGTGARHRSSLSHSVETSEQASRP
ncbi:thiamine pyrophosphate-binding protein [Mesorhizobium sp. 1M-11]|uniref:thiamine pyrophosphate-binding protein n=1 Tax=Mesorhizobium sp. 1M-11 TaxID=1529006 RepID=UPI0009E880D1|nr:thiamine pyrophosphate-binding protein [Mesorhizobium sp. 1M-11]